MAAAYLLLRSKIPAAAAGIAIRRLSSSSSSQYESWLSTYSSPLLLPEERDLKHWLVFCQIPRRFCLPRESRIDLYIGFLAKAVGSVEEAKRRMYSVSTRYFNAFGALLTQDQTHKVYAGDWGVEDIVLDPSIYSNKIQYKGEPFINGVAVPYDPKYHQEWIRINGKEESIYSSDEDYIYLGKEEQVEPRMKTQQHIVVCMNTPTHYRSREEIIDSYIKTLALLLGSEEEARKKICWVSTRMYYAFGVNLSINYSSKLLEGLPGVDMVYPDSDIDDDDDEDKEYGVEPFVNGEAVPYDPKYHKNVKRNHCLELDWFRRQQKEELLMNIKSKQRITY